MRPPLLRLLLSQRLVLLSLFVRVRVCVFVRIHIILCLLPRQQTHRPPARTPPVGRQRHAHRVVALARRGRDRLEGGRAPAQVVGRGLRKCGEVLVRDMTDEGGHSAGGGGSSGRRRHA